MNTDCAHDATVYDSHTHRTFCDGCGASWAPGEAPNLSAADVAGLARLMRAVLAPGLQELEDERITAELEAAERVRDDERARWATRHAVRPIGRDPQRRDA